MAPGAAKEVRLLPRWHSSSIPEARCATLGDDNVVHVGFADGSLAALSEASGKVLAGPWKMGCSGTPCQAMTRVEGSHSSPEGEERRESLLVCHSDCALERVVFDWQLRQYVGSSSLIFPIEASAFPSHLVSKFAPLVFMHE